jgi:hypothetical protein
MAPESEGPDLDRVQETLRDEREEVEEASVGEDPGPDVVELDRDPAYDPDDENLKDVKGG